MKSLGIGINELRSELKKHHRFSVHDVIPNLDYLIQSGWVLEIRRSRQFTTPGGTVRDSEQIKYKISEAGINHLEAGTIFTKPESTRNIKVTNVNGVTIIGDGNVVNESHIDLARALTKLDEAIAQAKELSDRQKIEAGADIVTIRSQISKPTPNKSIIIAAWEGLKGLVTIASLAGHAKRVGELIANSM